ncbi:MAG: hypothetical protein Q4B50_06365 [Bacillota bacterium]|nr:hypothetical protein [Bacillota bacterium]
MAVQVTNYQCPACTGPLQFDPESGKLACEYCGSSFPVAEIEALYAEKDAKAAENMAQAEAKREQAAASAGEGWDVSGLNNSWGEEGEGMRAYNCPSCGAELICEETTAATSCPYCGNPSVVPGQFGGTLKPDYVIPFKLKKENAIATLKKHYEGRPLLPRAFKEANHLEEIKGVYVPFWLFDGEAEGDALFEATRVRSYRSGGYEITETSFYDIYRSGSLAFEKIPVDGSQKMPDDYMDSIEPYNYEDLTTFSTAYLPGYLADKYDVDAIQCSSRADQRAENTVLSSLRDTVSGYSSVYEKNHNISLRRGKVVYALLPVWLLNTKWNGENFLFAMNGQTGKMVGNLPVDKKKKWRIFGLVYGVAALITAAIVLFPGGLLNLLGV